ncbi:vanadium-dependent haloperoxidase [Actinoplanes sp. NPDC000266]
MYAMVHIAIHDALNAIDLRSRPYAFHGRAPGASPTAAVAAAARGVLVPLLRELPAPFADCVVTAKVVEGVEAKYAAALRAVPDGSAKTRGVVVGSAAAAKIRAVRAGDGSDTNLFDQAYPQGTRPGEYRFTPGSDFAFAPGWAAVTPFTLRTAAQFRPGPPYAVSSKPYARDFAEVKRLGGDGVTTPSARTADQTQVARFWVESSPLMWNRIARQAAEGRSLDLWQNARLFGLLNMALADGYVATFDTKYRAYNFWRPVTAIRAAATDGNPATSADPTWTPLVVTPPIPDYDSGHSVEGGVAARVLQRFFGTDRARFTVCSYTLPSGQTCADPSPVLRRFTSFSQAEAENGVSRILVGFHFRKAVREGIAHGEKVGDWAVNRHLQRLPRGH